MRDKLIVMANQIGQFFGSQRGRDPVEDIADHLRRFWDPRMRREAIALLRDGGERLDPLPRQAIEILARDDSPVAQQDGAA